MLSPKKPSYKHYLRKLVTRREVSTAQFKAMKSIGWTSKTSEQSTPTQAVKPNIYLYLQRTDIIRIILYMSRQIIITFGRHDERRMVNSKLVNTGQTRDYKCS